jgi:hypothetical protein
MPIKEQDVVSGSTGIARKCGNLVVSPVVDS